MEIVIQIFVGGLFVLRGLSMIYPVWHKWRTARLLNEHDSHEINATITWIGKRSKRGFRHTYYSYTVDGTRFNHSVLGNISRRAPGGLLPIRYLADNPSVHEIVGTSKRLLLKHSLDILYGVSFILGGFALAILGPERLERL